MYNRIKELCAYKEMICGLIHRDLRGRYKGSLLGFLWNFLNPVFQIAVYIVVFSAVFRTGIEKFYVYLLVGIMPWNFFADSLVQGAGCILMESNLVTKIYFPREVLPVSLVCSKLIGFLISYGIVILIMLAGNYGMNLYVILALPSVIILHFLFTLGLVLLLSSLDVYFRDFQYMTGILLNALFWATPVMYSVDMLGSKLRLLILLNPMTSFISLYQNILYYKVMPSSRQWALAMVLALFALVGGEWVFLKLEKKFAEKL